MFVVADFLDALAAGQVTEIGEFGPEEQYTDDEQKQIGPQVSLLRQSGFICRAAQGRSSKRKYAKGRFSQVWRAELPADCKRKAGEFRQQALKMDDDGGFIGADKQGELF